MKLATKLVAALLAAACGYGNMAGRASAQNGLDPGADILGIHLGESIDAVRDKIASRFPGAQSFEVTTQVTTPANSQTYKIGTLFDITTSEDAAANQGQAEADQQDAQARIAAGLSSGSPLDRKIATAGEYGRERLTLIWDAGADGNGSAIFGIGRAKEFLAAERPLATDTVASLVAKYGRPTAEIVANSRALYLFWSSVPRPDRTTCLRGERFPYLYEDPGAYQIEPFERNADSLRNYFISDVNSLHNRNPLSDRSRCGTMLRANLDLSDDLTYVKRLDENLVDLPGGQKALVTLANDFFAQAGAAEEKKRQAASRNKPKL